MTRLYKCLYRNIPIEEYCDSTKHLLKILLNSCRVRLTPPFILVLNSPYQPCLSLYMRLQRSSAPCC